MPQSLSNVLVHFVFSTKNRRPLILTEHESELYSYINSICQSYDSKLISIAGTADHIHIVVKLGRTITISTLIQKIKSTSSKWIKSKSDRYSNFAWQSGYGAFSIGASMLSTTTNYILHQKEHHQKVSFQEEYRKLLDKYGVAFDEAYVWD